MKRRLSKSNGYYFLCCLWPQVTTDAAYFPAHITSSAQVQPPLEFPLLPLGGRQKTYPELSTTNFCAGTWGKMGTRHCQALRNLEMDSEMDSDHFYSSIIFSWSPLACKIWSSAALLITPANEVRLVIDSAESCKFSKSYK